MGAKIEREKRIVAEMIELYCRHKEGNARLCDGCRALTDYACARLDRCPHGERKHSCRSCVIHCYKPDMKMRIRAVMRYAGPRMLWYHPMDAILHLIR